MLVEMAPSSENYLEIFRAREAKYLWLKYCGTPYEIDVL